MIADFYDINNICDVKIVSLCISATDVNSLSNICFSIRDPYYNFVMYVVFKQHTVSNYYKTFLESC